MLPGDQLRFSTAGLYSTLLQLVHYMSDQRVERLAKLCVQYSAGVKPREQVLIRGGDQALPLINEIYKECLLSDAFPFLMPDLEVDYTFYRYAKEHQLKHVSPFLRFLYRNIDVSINIRCQSNPKRLTNIDPGKIREHSASRKDLVEIFSKRAAKGELRWTLVAYPINAQAQEAGMSLEEYEDFVYGSCFADEEDPIREWKKIHEQQEKVCAFLDQKAEMRIIGQDTDLKLNIKDRKWINSDGKKNMPSGEVFTAPLENSADGKIRFTYPGIYAGREVEDITLAFKHGRVTKASATKGAELLEEILKIKGAGRIGEIAVGTNYGIAKFTKNMLFDEKMGGTIHMALGNSYQESGGRNKSAIHWDILKDMRKDSEIYVDEELLYKDGEFLI